MNITGRNLELLMKAETGRMRLSELNELSKELGLKDPYIDVGDFRNTRINIERNDDAQG